MTTATSTINVKRKRDREKMPSNKVKEKRSYIIGDGCGSRETP